jgi:outer membrane protein TolC
MSETTRALPWAAAVLAFFLSSGALAAQTSAPAADDPLAGLPVVRLAEAVQAAQHGGPAVRTAQLALDAAQAALTQARAKEGLTVGESAGYVYSGTTQGTGPVALSASSGATQAGSSTNLGSNVKGGVSVSGPESSLGVAAVESLPQNATDNVTSFGLSGSQVLWDGTLGGTTGANVRIAEDAFKVASATQEAAVKTAIYQAQEAYYTLLGDQKTLLVRQATLKQSQQNLATEEGLRQNQLATDLDVLQMQVIERQAELDLRTELNQISYDRKSLSILLGWPLEKTYVASDEDRPSPAVQNADEALKTALSHRYELASLEAQIDSAQVTVNLQKAAYSPVVSLTGSLASGLDWTAGAATQNYTLGLDVALPPVWDGGNLGAQVQQASDQVATYEIARDQERQTITAQVQNAWFSVTDTKDRLDLAVTNVQQAQGVYDLEKLKLSVGLETVLDVLTAFTTLTTAQVGLEQAKSNYILAVLALNNALGL